MREEIISKNTNLQEYINKSGMNDEEKDNDRL